MNAASIIAEVSLKAGVMLMKSGAEVYRVENTMERIAYSFNPCTQCMAYVTLTGAIVTVSAQGETITRMARIENIGNNLHQIHQINALSRRCEQRDMTPEETLATLHQIEDQEPYSSFAKVITGAVGAVGFGIFFGGNWKDMLAIFVIALVVQILGSFFEKIGLNEFLALMVQAGVTAAGCLWLNKAISGTNFDTMILSVLMLLVPGMVLTNAIRDTLTGNYLSGFVCFAKALFVGAFIAVGACVVLYGRI